MESPITSHHFTGALGNPSGGITYGHGFTIAWQNGPIVKDDGLAVGNVRNGAFVEDVIKAAIDRIDYYQSTAFACQENADALSHLRQALAACNARTARRIAAGVEGTHKGN